VVQEAFPSTLRARAQFRGHAHPSTWLYRATVNAALMHLRSRRRRPTEPLGDDHRQFAAESIGADALMARRERGAGLARTLEGLMPVDRELVRLRLVEEVPTPAAAKALGLSVAAAKTRLSRARSALRRSLAEAARA
jgi:RNA polymerase sigma-70 factor (ECF subfamily)